MNSKEVIIEDEREVPTKKTAEMEYRQSNLEAVSKRRHNNNKSAGPKHN